MESFVEKAHNLARSVLKDQTRSDGTPFIGHPEAVARIVSEEIGLPDECVAAVYLHEATREHKDLDVSGFPQDVRTMAEGLNKISVIRPKDTRLEAENYKKLIVQYSTDPRVTVIKIADRLEVMRNLAIFPPRSREQKALETLMLYIPLAHQLGLYNIKGELENIYFRYACPEDFRAITNKLKATEPDREKLTREFIEPLKTRLTSEGIRYKLKIRTKAAYSIYKKMQTQKVPFEGVFDVFAIRFIIDCDSNPAVEKDMCWKVYSYVTEEYESDTTRLRDWVTNPKPNGYESLHITVKNRQGAYVEVQIRTKRMDDEAENGAAAHWAYKGIRHEQSLDRWLSSVRYNLEHPAETKVEDMPSPPSREIFVFTPSGELRTLPAGASLLDFAFNIHSGLGCKCCGGKVNGKAVPIKEKLKTGDVIEIQTGKNQKPGPGWLDWVVTSKARTKIKLELDAEERKAAAEGREILERRLKNWKLEFPDEMQREFMKLHKFSSVLTLMASVFRGETELNDIKTFIQEADERHEASVRAATEQEAVQIGSRKAFSGSGSDDIIVLGARNVKGMDYRMSKCCNPVFGDDVFGFVTRTEGIKIHRMSCPNAARLIEKYPYRIQKVIWQENEGSANFQCTLGIISEPDNSVTGEILNVIGQFKASVRSFNVNENLRKGVFEISVRLLVPSNLELDKILSQLSILKSVIKVRRI